MEVVLVEERGEEGEEKKRCIQGLLSGRHFGKRRRRRRRKRRKGERDALIKGAEARLLQLFTLEKLVPVCLLMLYVAVQVRNCC